MSKDTVYELPNVLIGAGRRAWQLYSEANSNSTLDEDAAVSLLAKHLVALATEGTTQEGALVAAGLQYLISLTTPPSSISNDEDVANEDKRQLLELRIDSANAKFLLQWRIPWV